MRAWANAAALTVFLAMASPAIADTAFVLPDRVILGIPPTTKVPEPSTAVLLTAGAVALLRLRRRNR
jgi:hypothetical protein